MIPEWTADYVGLDYAEADCWALARRILMEQFDCFVPSYAGEPIDLALDAGRRYMTEVETPELGDLVLMQRCGRPHIGVMLDAERMLHTSRGKNAVIERISRFKHRVAGYYRIPRAGEEEPAVA